MKIHPTAIIDPKAQLHESVEVGPYTIIERDVVIGEGTVLHAGVRIHEGTTLGKLNTVFHGASLGGIPQDFGFDPNRKTKLVIGDSNVFRENVIIHRATKDDKPTTFGDKNYIMGCVHFAHDCQVGNNNIVVQNSILAGHVHFGNNVFVSGLVAVHQFGRVGDYAMLAGCSKIVKDVPPYSTIDGNPATIIGLNTVGLKRAGFSSDIRLEIKRIYKLIYHSGLNTKQALAEIRKRTDYVPEVENVIRFFETSKRGVTAHRKIGGSSEEEE